MGDPAAAARLSRVALVGTLEFPEGGGRIAVEETAVWPDRYQLRLRGGTERPTILALTGAEMRLSLPASWPPSFQPTEGFARLRLRSLFVLAYNLGNFLRQSVLPKAARHRTLTRLREKLIKIGAKVVSRARYVTFQMAEVAVPREVFKAILERIGRLRLPAAVAG